MRIRRTFQRVHSLSRFSSSLAAAAQSWIWPSLLMILATVINHSAGAALAGRPVIRVNETSDFCRLSQRPPQQCVYYLTAQSGFFHSLNFPRPFPVPILCRWIINATGYGKDTAVNIYLNQMYLKRGVRVVSYYEYSPKQVIGRRDLGDISYRGRLVAFAVPANYVEVQLSLDSLDNANIRVRNFLLDVYGFNITYEIVQINPLEKITPRSGFCHVGLCNYNGNCYTASNYNHSSCHCQEGYFGEKCQYGPDCNPGRGINLCKNSGRCEYNTGSFVRCICGLGYSGTTCEHRREVIENTTECQMLTNLTCIHFCKISGDNVPSCGCPSGYGLGTDGRTCYSLGPRRLISELQLRAEIETEKHLEIIEQTLRENVLNASAQRLTVGNVVSLDGRLTIIMWITDCDILRNCTCPVNINSSIAANNSDASPTITGIAKAKELIASHPERPDPSNSTPAIPNIISSQTSCFPNANKTAKWEWLVSSTVSHLKALSEQTGSFGQPRIELNKTPLKYWEEEGLILEWVKVDRSDRLIKEGDPFTIVCKARGSGHNQNVSFAWYKDGFFVDPSQALRSMRIISHPPDLKGWYRSHLVIEKASIYDRGEFRCEIGQAEEKSVLIDILTAPQIKMTFLSSTISRGSPFTVSCFDKNPLTQSRRKYPSTYVWYREGHLVRNSCEESFEDVHPIGSLLRVAEVNESTNYTCEVTNQVQKSRKVVRVNVAPLPSPKYRYCPAEIAKNVSWSETAPDLFDEKACPMGYKGFGRRYCQEHKFISVPGLADGDGCTRGVWSDPELGDCVSEVVLELQEKAEKLALGFNVSTMGELAKEIELHVEKLMSNRTEWFPGEGSNMVHLLEKVAVYLREKKPNASLASAFLKTADNLLREGFVTEAESLATFLEVGGILASITTLDQKFDTFNIEILSLDNNTKGSGIAASIDRSGEKVRMKLPLNVLPQRAYLIRYSNTFPLLASLQLHPEFAHTEALSYPLTLSVPDVNCYLRLEEMREESWTPLINATIPKLRAFTSRAEERIGDWTPVCAILWNNTWHTELCRNEDHFHSNHVVCQCKAPGTVAVLWLSGLPKGDLHPVARESLSVSLGALGGMLLSLPSMWIWATMWYRQRLGLTWLKLQFSCSVFAALCTLANATFRTPSLNVFPFVFYVLLAGFALCVTSLFGILALSFFPLEDTRSAANKIVPLSGVVCFLIMVSHMIVVHSQGNRWANFWWLTDTLQIVFFVVTNGLLACAMFALYFTFKRKVLKESPDFPARHKMAHTSLGLLLCVLAVEVTSVCYVCKPSASSKSFLVVACMTLGLGTLVTYFRHDCGDCTALRWKETESSNLESAGNSNSVHGKAPRCVGEASERLLSVSQNGARPRKASLPLLKRAGLGPEVQIAFEEEVVQGGEAPVVKSSRYRSVTKIEEEENHVMLEERFGTVREACELRDLCDLVSMPGIDEDQQRKRGDSGLGASNSDDSRENQPVRKRSLKSNLSLWSSKFVAVISDFRSRQNTVSSENTAATTTEECDSVLTNDTDLESRKESLDSGQQAPHSAVLHPAVSCLLPGKPSGKTYASWKQVEPNDSSSKLLHAECHSRRTLKGLPRPIFKGWADVVTREEFQRNQNNFVEITQVEAEGSELVKPHRGKFLLRISPEKKAILNGRIGPKVLSMNRHRRYGKLPVVPTSVSIKNCERCWINPESPACDLCYHEHTISTYAHLEALPRDDSEYMTMNCSGNRQPDNDYLKMSVKTTSTIVSVHECRSGDVNGWELGSHRSNPSAPNSPAAGRSQDQHPLPRLEMKSSQERKTLPRFSSVGNFVKPITASQQSTPTKFCRSLDRRRNNKSHLRKKKPWLLSHSTFVCHFQQSGCSPFNRYRRNVVHKSDFDFRIDSRVRPFRYSLATL